jgi:hypothetical protein
LTSLFVFYTAITVHNLLIFAPNRLQNTQNAQNAHQAHQAIGLTRHQASFWVGLGLAYLIQTTVLCIALGRQQNLETLMMKYTDTNMRAELIHRSTSPFILHQLLGHPGCWLNPGAAASLRIPRIAQVRDQRPYVRLPTLAPPRDRRSAGRVDRYAPRGHLSELFNVQS